MWIFQSAAKEMVHRLYEYCSCIQEGQFSNLSILLQASFMPMQAAPFHKRSTILNIYEVDRLAA